jgi:hypothetical protein
MADRQASSLTADQVEKLAKQVFDEQGRTALIISVWRDKNREEPHWLIRWSETGITLQAFVAFSPTDSVDKFRDPLVRGIKNAATV